MPANAPERIHLIDPAYVVICEAEAVIVCIVIVEIKNEQPAGPVCEQRIDSKHIAAILLLSLQVRLNLPRSEADPRLVLAVLALDFLPVSFWAHAVSPEIIALREISRLAGILVLKALGVHVGPSPEVREEKPCLVHRHISVVSDDARSILNAGLAEKLLEVSVLIFQELYSVS